MKQTQKTRPCPLPIKKLGKREEIPKKMRNFVGSFDCIDKAKICPAAAICTTKTTIYPRIQRLGSRASNKEKENNEES